VREIQRVYLNFVTAIGVGPPRARDDRGLPDRDPEIAGMARAAGGRRPSTW
jgi:hypothetical protein